MPDLNTALPVRRAANVDLDHDARYWTRQLSISAAELDAAVMAVGPWLNDIQRWLAAKANRAPAAA